MRVLNNITIKSLKLNKKRAAGTIIGIILAVALICAVGGLVTSYRKTLVTNAINERGYHHIELDDITEEKYREIKLNRDVKTVRRMYNLGYAKYDNKNASYLVENEDVEYSYIKVYSMDKSMYNDIKFNICEGRVPSNENEVVICSELALNSDYKVGEYIELNVGKLPETETSMLEVGETNNEENNGEVVDGVSYRFKIVGVVEKSRWNSSVNYVITTGKTSDIINGFVALKNPLDYKKSIVGILGAKNYDEVKNNSITNIDYSYILNDELLRWEVFAFSDESVKALLAIAAVVIAIVIIVSVFCIRNSFDISTTEKLKIYGMFSSIGATKKQIKKSVVFEGFILGLIGIPLGILSGCMAVVGLIQFINILGIGNSFVEYTSLTASISIYPIITAIVLGAITIYLSSISAARRASKVSPIENIRSNNDINISKKKLRTPKFIKHIFNIGGVIAYKNLKRSKKKYRTTVISLTISVFAFISMNAFLEEALVKSFTNFSEYDYNILLTEGVWELNDEQIKNITDMEQVDKSYVIYRDCDSIKLTDKTKLNDIIVEEYFSDKDEKNNYYDGLDVLALDTEFFEEYVEELGLSSENIDKQGILCDGFGNMTGQYDVDENERVYKYQEGDYIKGNYMASSEEISGKSYDISIKVAKVTDTRPMGYEKISTPGGFLVINKDQYKNIKLEPDIISIVTKESYEVQKLLRHSYPRMGIDNLEENSKRQNSMALIYRVFIYGFIGIITLIGMTNIFNTITSNMELRQKELAMLKSVGMTKREFNKMINLETIFYSTRALVYGIILGLGGAYLIHKAFDIREKTEFNPPYTAVIISIIFVFVIVYIIMKYSISKLNKKNIIETIRNENI